MDDFDLVVTRDVLTALKSHRDLAHLDLSVEVKGGAAHIRGNAINPETRELLRQTVAKVKGVLAVWEVARLGEAEPVILDFGCGSAKQFPQAVGVDRIKTEAVDIVADLEKDLPIATASADHVFAVHVLEHLHNLFNLMNEAHRILKPDGLLHVIVPNWLFVNSVADPTHVRFFDLQTFKFFCLPQDMTSLYRPICAMGTGDSVYADLAPVADGGEPDLEAVTRFFD